MEKDFDVIVIGAGVVGLAIAYELSKEFFVGIIEKNKKYGLETSSRNSEVIHSGIHYQTGSLKAILSVQGNELIYKFCEENNIPFKKIGKLTIATDEKEEKKIEEIYKIGIENGVIGIKILDEREIKKISSAISGKIAIYTPTTGILNVHYLMDCLYNKFLENGGICGFSEKVINIEMENSVFMVETEKGRYYSEILINSAGLGAEEISKKIGVNYEVFWAKGDYFTISKKIEIPLLVYPVPLNEALGIHITPRFDGILRAGPDIEYVEKRYPAYPENEEQASYKVDENKREIFYRSVKKLIGEVEIYDFIPESYGIRPKLQKKGGKFKDFVIKQEIPGFINLIGIDSPGLTSCLSIARYVKKLLK